jgi:hypothetical protein
VSARQASRQDRQQAFQPYLGPVATLLSEDQHAYTDGVPAAQAKYAADATYNGTAAQRRLKEGSDG